MGEFSTVTVSDFYSEMRVNILVRYCKHGLAKVEQDGHLGHCNVECQGVFHGTMHGRRSKGRSMTGGGVIGAPL